MDFDELNDFLAESNRRARFGRAIAQLMFILTAGVVGFFVYSFVMAPRCGSMLCPMFDPPPYSFAIGVIIGMVGFVGLASGLFWMWRIVRADPLGQLDSAEQPDP